MRTVSLRWVSIAVVTLGLVCSSSGRAQAQTEAEVKAARQPVPADFKGAVGLGLIGAELGAVIPALAGMDATWAYIVFPVVGAAGGAVGGYFAIDNPGHAQLSVAALTLGMALVIPALVITLQLTAYDPQTDTDNSQARNRLRRMRQLAAAGPGMLRLSEGELALAAPGVALVPARAAEPWRVSGVSVSLLSGQF